MHNELGKNITIIWKIWVYLLFFHIYLFSFYPLPLASNREMWFSVLGKKNSLNTGYSPYYPRNSEYISQSPTHGYMWLSVQCNEMKTFQLDRNSIPITKNKNDKISCEARLWLNQETCFVINDWVKIFSSKPRKQKRCIYGPVQHGLCRLHTHLISAIQQEKCTVIIRLVRNLRTRKCKWFANRHLMSL